MWRAMKRAYHDRSIWLLHHAADAKRRRASARRVDGDDNVIRILGVVVVESVPVNLHGFPLEKVVDVRCVEGLGIRVGAHAHTLTKQHGRVLGEECCTRKFGQNVQNTYTQAQSQQKHLCAFLTQHPSYI